MGRDFTRGVTRGSVDFILSFIFISIDDHSETEKGPFGPFILSFIFNLELLLALQSREHLPTTIEFAQQLLWLLYESCADLQ